MAHGTRAGMVEDMAGRDESKARLIAVVAP